MKTLQECNIKLSNFLEKLEKSFYNLSCKVL